MWYKYGRQKTIVFYGPLTKNEVNMKKFLALILALSMIFTLCACGGSSESSSQSSAPAAKAEATPAPEYVYESSFKSVHLDTQNISTFGTDGNGFYILVSKTVPGEPPEGVTPNYEGQFDTTEQYLKYIGFDGSVIDYNGNYNMENIVCEDGFTPLYFGSYVTMVAKNSSGNFQAIVSRYLSYTDDSSLTPDSPDYYDHQYYTYDYWIRELDESGNEVSREQIVVGEDESIYGNSVLDSNDNFLIPTNSGVRAIGLDGNTAYNIELGESCDSVFKGTDGRVYASTWSGSNVVISEIDTESRKLGESVTVKNYNTPIAGGGDYRFYYTDGTKFKAFDEETGENVTLFSWLDCGINPDSAYGTNTVVLDDGTVVTCIYDYNDDSSTDFDIATVKEVPYDSVKHKQELTLGTLSLSWEAQQTILDFNKNDKDYKISVIEYRNDEDWDAGIDKMKTEIIAGNVPDILDLSSLPVDQLAAKGFLEDLTPYIEGDSEIDLDDLFPNVVDTVRFGDKIISTVSSFSVQTVIGASKLVGDEPGWTYQDFKNALAEMPEGCDPFDEYMTRETMLRTCLNLDMNDFVDWATGEVDFNNQEFYDLLEFAKSFPVDYDWENSEFESTEQRIAEGKQMLMFGYLSDFDYALYESTMFGDTDITYVGFPTNNGVGNMLNVGTGYAMSSTCKDKDAAWRFLRSFMTEEYMDDQYLFPASKSLFEKRLQKAMTEEYEKDDNGNVKLDADGNKILIAKVNQVLGGNVIVRYAVDEVLAGKIRSLVYDTTKVAAYDEEINTIVINQAEAYFSGAKSVEEVAKLIQSQVNIYVNEQR